MKKRSLINKNKTERIKHERDPIPWRYCLLTLVCGLILVGGFFWAARQHFSAMDFGIKNAKLRKSKSDLETEQRRLALVKEMSLSPAEIKKFAQKNGLQDLTVQSIETINPIKSVEPETTRKIDQDVTKTTISDKTGSSKLVKETSRDLMTKTVSIKPSENVSKNQQSVLNRPRIAKAK